MQYSQEHLKTMVYAKFGGQTECIMGNSKIENAVRTPLWNETHSAMKVNLVSYQQPIKQKRKKETEGRRFLVDPRL